MTQEQEEPSDDLDLMSRMAHSDAKAVRDEELKAYATAVAAMGKIQATIDRLVLELEDRQRVFSDYQRRVAHPPALSWRDVFDSTKTEWGTFDNALLFAKRAGYLFYSWNGWVFPVEAESIYAGFRICRTDSLPAGRQRR